MRALFVGVWFAFNSICKSTNSKLFLFPLSKFFWNAVPKIPENVAQTKLNDSVNTSPSFNSSKARKRSSKTSLPQPAHSSRSSLQMFPIISGLVDKQNIEIGMFATSEEKDEFLNGFFFFVFKNMVPFVTVHFHRAAVQIIRWINHGRRHQIRKKTCTRGWLSSIKRRHSPRKSIRCKITKDP